MIGLSMLLLLIGYIIWIVGGIWFLIVSFQESVWWGLACLLSPAGLIFLIVHWRVAAKPFGVQCVGMLFWVGSIFLLPDGFGSSV